MKLFSKSIETKRDYFAEMRAAIDAAIDAALKNDVPPGLIQHELVGRGADFQLAEQAGGEARKRDPLPRIYEATEHGIIEIDGHAQATRDEETRIAIDLRRQQEAYAKSVDERTKREEFLRS
jgi:hypothetical protein